MKKEVRRNHAEIMSDINYIIRILGRTIERMDEAYVRKDHLNFNILKKQVLQLQRKIHSLM